MRIGWSAFWYVSLLLAATVHFSNNAVPFNRDQETNPEQTDGVIGLYSTKDDVEILTASNFKEKIYGSNKAWLVEFYNSWCGFCQRFAPSWKTFATDVRNWKDLVAIAVIDCSNELNNPICREFEVMAYPTLRYFHENYEEKPKNLGRKITTGTTADDHRHKLIDAILTEQNEGRGKQFPDIRPYNRDVSNVFDESPGKEFVVLIIQETNSYVGLEIALDLHKIPEITVRYAYNNNSDIVKSTEANTFPSVYIIAKNFRITPLQSSQNDRHSFNTVIKDYLRKNGVKIAFDEIQKPYVESTTKDGVAVMQDREREILMHKIKKMGDVVFQMDLETTFRQSLKLEIGNRKEIAGEKLHALRKYVDVLSKYFPFGKRGQSFLQELKEYVFGDKVSGETIFRMVSDAETSERQIFSTPHQWLGCRGSVATLRGYPCGLWKMFHFLTVNAAENPETHPKLVLDAMHGYVKHFFGCADCSRHFQEMALRRQLDKVASLDESILWLWKAHNEVNERLSGDKTEDPEFPKVPFPTRENCPQCRRSDASWDETQVLSYLKRVYAGINVRYIGADTRILHLGLDGLDAGGSGVMRAIDTSMCLLLYVSCLLLILVLIRMFLKGGYRKKRYRHDLLGKV